ncbi:MULTISPECIES: hypothetical protein [unclassified Gilliamella]|uniref:hypothetical protein n=2 Tax=unclassified Gilliamella TaxID=2685620 RepID=UPI00226AD08A|nr:MULTISPECIES: hypothetical protein [unclassified Gilliamella]MCX8665337.1 hypothetical protein [Gilliamella sp. B2887]MCX8698262.1 hypothetical protein [Gilliamella sp. B3000]
MKYFSYDHHGNGIEYHNTEEEAKAYAQECLDSYTQNDNHDFIDICWGEIKESVHSNNDDLELKPIRRCTYGGYGRGIPRME